MTTPILDIVEATASQVNKVATINLMVTDLESAMNDVATDTSTGTTDVDYSIATGTPATFFENFIFRLTGTKTGAASLITPATTPVGLVATKRFFCVENETSQDITVECETAGTQVTLATGLNGLFYQEGVNIIQVAAAEAAAAVPYDLALFQPTVPITDQIIAEFKIPRAITIADDFALSQGYTGVNPTATFVIDIQKNGTDVGDVSFTTGGVPTFTTDATTISLAAGDRLSFVAPTTVDATAANIAITIAATVD